MPISLRTFLTTLMLSTGGVVLTAHPLMAADAGQKLPATSDSNEETSREELIDLLTKTLDQLTKAPGEEDDRLEEKAGQDPTSAPADTEQASDQATGAQAPPGDAPSENGEGDQIINLLAKTLRDQNIRFDEPSQPSSTSPNDVPSTTGASGIDQGGTVRLPSELLKTGESQELLLSAYKANASIDSPITNVRRSAFPFLNGNVVHFLDLYFDANSDGLSDGAKRRLQQVVNWVRLLPEIRRITVVSQTDTRGSSLHNRDVSRIRADRVASYLRLSGLNDMDIAIEALGESYLIEQTDDGVSEPLNRVVSLWGHLN